MSVGIREIVIRFDNDATATVDSDCDTQFENAGCFFDKHMIACATDTAEAIREFNTEADKR